MLDCQPSLCVAIDDWRYPATRRSPVGGLTIDSLRQYMCQNISSSIPAPRSDPLTPPPSLRKSTPLEHRNTPAHQPTAPTTPHPSPRPPTYHSPTPPLGSLDPLAPRPPPPNSQAPIYPLTHLAPLKPVPLPPLPFPSLPLPPCASSTHSGRSSIIPRDTPRHTGRRHVGLPLGRLPRNGDRAQRLAVACGHVNVLC